MKCPYCGYDSDEDDGDGDPFGKCMVQDGEDCYVEYVCPVCLRDFEEDC